jgi:ABC-type antimicrobial peptide transport system ATPase subunit
MNITVQIQHFGVRPGVAQLWRAARTRFIRLCTAVAEEILNGEAIRTSHSLQDAQRQVAIADAQVLRRAVRANFSNEVDWLLCAAILTDPAKRRYCLERALALNPDCELAKQALASIAMKRTA